MSEKIRFYFVDGGVVFKRLMFIKLVEFKGNNENKLIKNKSGILRKVLRKVKNGLVILDMYYGWVKKVVVYGKELIEREKIDVIFFMYEFFFLYLCVYYIKK